MSKRVSPTERLRAEIDEVFAGGEDLSRAIERVAQLGAQLLLQSAVEAEVAAFLGRDRYERAASCGDPHPGMRNGYCPTTVIILSREVIMPLTRGSPMRTVSLTRFSAWPDENCGFVCRRVAAAEDVGSALFA